MQQTTSPYAPWQLAARRLVAETAQTAYKAANLKPDGTRKRKAHTPYSLPDWVKPLLAAVEQDDEAEAKRIMLCVRLGTLTLV